MLRAVCTVLICVVIAGACVAEINMRVDRVSGGFVQPVQSDDVSAITNSIYYSTDTSRLSYKDSSAGSVSISYSTTFTNGSLSASQLTVVHNLGDQYPIVQVVDYKNELVIPDHVRYIDTTTCRISFSSSVSLSGTWKVKAIK